MTDGVPGPELSEKDLNLEKLRLEVAVKRLELKDRSSLIARGAARAGALVVLLGLVTTTLTFYEKFAAAEVAREAAVGQQMRAEAGLDVQTENAMESDKALTEVRDIVEKEPADSKIRTSIKTAIERTPAGRAPRGTSGDPRRADMTRPEVAEYREELDRVGQLEAAQRTGATPDKAALSASRARLTKLGTSLRPEEIRLVHRDQGEMLKRQR